MGWVKQNYSLPVPAAATTGWLCPHVDFLKPFPLCLFVLIFLFVPLQIKKSVACHAKRKKLSGKTQKIPFKMTFGYILKGIFLSM